MECTHETRLGEAREPILQRIRGSLERHRFEIEEARDGGFSARSSGPGGWKRSLSTKQPMSLFSRLSVEAREPGRGETELRITGEMRGVGKGLALLLGLELLSAAVVGFIVVSTFNQRGEPVPSYLLVFLAALILSFPVLPFIMGVYVKRVARGALAALAEGRL